MANFFGIDSPFIGLCGIRPLKREEGRVLGEVEVTKALGNASGFGHGGLTMTLLDVVLGAAARLSDPDSTAVVTVDLHVTFIGAARGRLVGEGRLLRRAGEIVLCEGDVHRDDGKLVAKALGTFKLRLGARSPHRRGAG
jgi:uncharacterized protein (TIGR00369 family)